MHPFLIAALLSVPVPALAETAPPATGVTVTPHSGEMLRDVNKLRLGAIDSVKSDGSVGVIVNARYVLVPAATLTMVDGKLATSLSKKDLLASR